MASVIRIGFSRSPRCPLQDPTRAARELERAVTRLGLRAPRWAAMLAAFDLDVAGIEPVFASAQRLDVPLFLHPQIRRYFEAGRSSPLESCRFPMETRLRLRG